MTDYKNMSIQAIFDSFDTNKKDGIIDKKEAKMAKNLYNNIFTIKKGMNVSTFKEVNNNILVDKDIHSSILNQVENCRKTFYGIGDPVTFIRNSASYFALQDIKLKFEDLEPYLEKSDRIDNLKNAFKLLDKIDTVKKEIRIGGDKSTFDFQEDNYFDTINLTGYRTLSLLFFSNTDGHITKREKIEMFIQKFNIDCTAEDVETLLLALCLKRAEGKHIINNSYNENK